MKIFILGKVVMRECGDCNMCCKLPSVKNLKKDYEWCKHCEIGVGCKIYEERPKQCKDFYCLWKMNLLSESLKPNKVGFFVMMENEHSATEKVLTVYCETHKINSIPKYLKNERITDNSNIPYRYCIRYNDNDNDLVLFNLNNSSELFFIKRRKDE